MASPSFEPLDRARRGWLGQAAASVLGAAAPRAIAAQGAGMTTVWTFGDSVLDCSRYNDAGLDPGRLLVRNDDGRFPEFRGHDLQSRGPARLEHRAVDGATVDGLLAQLPARFDAAAGVALLSVGGNDLLRGLVADAGAGVREFEKKLRAFVARLPLRPLYLATVYDPSLYLATVYDPTFGDDRQNFLGVDAKVARANHGRVNDAIRAVAADTVRLVDLQAHFLHGRPDWFTRTIEPSLVGASEVRRAFAAAMGLV